MLRKGEMVLNMGYNLWKSNEKEERYEFGSTFEKNEESKKENLIFCLKENILPHIKYQIVGEKIGIRPSSRDMVHPFVGESPKQNNFYILNGFGSKSFSLAPFFSGNLADHLTNNTEIPLDANIKRFN